MVGYHNSTHCNRSQDQWFPSENRNNAEGSTRPMMLILHKRNYLWNPGADLFCWHATLKKYCFFHTVFCPPANYSGTNFQIRNQIRTTTLIMKSSSVTTEHLAFKEAFFFLSFLPRCLSPCRFRTSPFRSLHADGKLCVYFKNRFATLHIPAHNPASCCRATLTGTLLSGAETRGCRQQTRPLEIIISLLPESITAIQWSARPWETPVGIFPLPVLSSAESYSINQYSFALHST